MVLCSSLVFFATCLPLPSVLLPNSQVAYFVLHFPANFLFPCKLFQILKQLLFYQHHWPEHCMSHGSCCCLQGRFMFLPSLLVPAYNRVLHSHSVSFSQLSSSRGAEWCMYTHRFCTLLWLQVHCSQTSCSTRSWRKICLPACLGAFLFLLQYAWLSWQSCWTLLLNCVHPQVQCREFYLPDSPSA